MSHHTVTLAEARLAYDAQGVPYSERFGDVYHSADGGPGQARHVFLRGNDLPQRWRDRACFTILETGFGLGLNFLETWRALEEDASGPGRLNYVSVESQPFGSAALDQAHRRWPEHRERSRALTAAWPLPLRGYHRLHLAGGRITLTLLLGDALESLTQLQAGADAFFLDGFAPSRNPEMWSAGLFGQLARLANPGATLATWSVAGAVREGLGRAGFHVGKRPGYSGKRDMLAGTIDLPDRKLPCDGERRVMVIGAGLAGSACAHRLAERGWNVLVLERHREAALEGSGNPLGLCAPLVNVADGDNARISRAAFSYARLHYQALGMLADPLIVDQGILRILRSAREAERYRSALQGIFPPAFARYVDLDEAAALAGHACSRPGIWFDAGMSLDPARVCAAQLQHPRICTRHGSGVHTLTCGNGSWKAADAAGRLLGEAEHVIAAAAMGSAAFVPGLRLESVRGQITLLPADRRRQLRHPVSGEGYGITLPDGRLLIGATFQVGDDETGVRLQDHATNMARVEAALPGLCLDARPSDAQGRVGFRAVTPDRLPLAGETAATGLHVLSGLGARGLSWAPLCAELLASSLAGDPLPLPADLVSALRPSRFT